MGGGGGGGEGLKLVLWRQPRPRSFTDAWLFGSHCNHLYKYVKDSSRSTNKSKFKTMMTQRRVLNRYKCVAEQYEITGKSSNATENLEQSHGHQLIPRGPDDGRKDPVRIALCRALLRVWRLIHQCATKVRSINVSCSRTQPHRVSRDNKRD